MSWTYPATPLTWALRWSPCRIWTEYNVSERRQARVARALESGVGRTGIAAEVGMVVDAVEQPLGVACTHTHTRIDEPRLLQQLCSTLPARSVFIFSCPPLLPA